MDWETVLVENIHGLFALLLFYVVLVERIPGGNHLKACPNNIILIEETGDSMEHNCPLTRPDDIEHLGPEKQEHYDQDGECYNKSLFLIHLI